MPLSILADTVIVTIFGVMEVECDLVWVLLTDIGRHAVDIRHKLHGIPEHVGIDFLEKIGLEVMLIIPVGHFIGRVDFADGDSFVGIDGSGKAELYAYLF